MLTKVVFIVFLLSFLHRISSKTIPEIKREILDQILPKNENDIMIAPGNLTSDVTNVEATMYILNVDDINEVKREVTLRLYFRQYWQDHRLRYIANTQFPYVTINNEDVIWIPDTFFTNERKSRSFDALRPNVLIRIFPDGNVVYSKKLSVTLNCPMDFTKYPFDKHLCNFRIESYGYTAENLMLKWKEQKSVGIYSLNPIPVFNLEKMRQSVGIVTLSKNYSYLGFDLYFTRDLSTCVYQIYLPTIAVLIVSWLQFFVNKKMITSRLLLGVGALLSYIITLNKFREEQPQSRDSKTMLCFTGTSTTFLIFSAILTVLVHFFDKQAESSVKLVENGDIHETNSKMIGLKAFIKKFPGKVSHVDLGARFIIPFMYMIFCIIYFASAGAFGSGEPIALPD